MTFVASVEEIVKADQKGLLSKHSTWERVPLGDIAKILNGFPFPSDNFSRESGTPLIRIRDILEGETETYFRGDYDQVFLVQPGELLVGMDGDFNAALWKGTPSLLNQRVCKLTPDLNFYDKDFLTYVLPGYLTAINAATPSLTVKHLSSRTVGDIPLPLPPASEQKRLAKKIDELFSDLDAGVAALERVRANLKRYRAAVLKAAVEGKLTEQWRKAHPDVEPASKLLEGILAERRRKWEKAQLAKFAAAGKAPPKGWKDKYPQPDTLDTADLPDLPKSWCWASFDQCANDITVGHVGPMKDRYVDDGIPFLRSQNVRPLRFDREGLKFIPQAFDRELAKSRLYGGELLVVRSGTVGDACVYPPEEPTANCADLVITRCLPGLLAQYAAIFVSSPTGRTAVTGKQTGSALTHFNVGAMVHSRFPLAPLPEQQQIVSEVDRLLSVCDEAEMQLAQESIRSGRLRQSILKRAFEGKLVPQDPKDEPASVLLDRIRNARTAEGQQRAHKRRKSPA